MYAISVRVIASTSDIPISSICSAKLKFIISRFWTCLACRAITELSVISKIRCNPSMKLIQYRTALFGVDARKHMAFLKQPSTGKYNIQNQNLNRKFAH